MWDMNQANFCVRYRGLAKSTAGLTMLFEMGKPWMARTVTVQGGPKHPMEWLCAKSGQEPAHRAENSLESIPNWP
jgi:hypothetical protein